jgi:hypothetical protein
MVTGTGRVLASGTAQSPIVFTSFGDDQYGGDIDNDGNIILLAPRAWKGVMFNSGGVGSTLNNVIIRYGGYDSGVPSSGDLTFYFFTGDYSLLTYLTLEYGDQGVYWSFSSPPNISTWTFHNNGIDIEPALP